MGIGRTISRALIASASVLALSGTAVHGAVLYQNPDPISSSPGNVDSFLINHGFAVSDSFVLGSSSTLSSIDFASWNTPGDDITSVDWTISTDAGDVGGAGTSLGGGTATVTDALVTPNNFPGFNLMLNTFNMNLDLSPGTYWLTLQNASVNGGSANLGEGVWWDQGGGSSQAWLNNIGIIDVANDCGGFGGPPDITGTPDSCSETFRINGSTDTSVPEPITLSLFGAGLAGVVAMRRRKAKAVVKAHRWFNLLRNGTNPSISDLARAEEVQRSYLGRLVPVAFLAPDITEAIIEGRQPIDLSLERLLEAMPLPLAWDEQRAVLGFPAR